MRKIVMIDVARRRADRAAIKLHQIELQQRMAEMAERVRDSEPAASARAKRAALRRKRAELAEKAQATGEEVMSKAQATGERLASKAQATGEELAARGSDMSARAQARTGEIADRRLRRMGARLSQGRSAELLGIEPSRRRFPWWAAGLVGVGAGYAIALVVGARRANDVEFDRDVASEVPIVEAVRRELTADPRTAGLGDLTVDVAEGIVFVRGTVPADCDPAALREVIEKVPGVQDVDLQVVGA